MTTRKVRINNTASAAKRNVSLGVLLVAVAFGGVSGEAHASRAPSAADTWSWLVEQISQALPDTFRAMGKNDVACNQPPAPPPKPPQSSPSVASINYDAVIQLVR